MHRQAVEDKRLEFLWRRYITAHESAVEAIGTAQQRQQRKLSAYAGLAYSHARECYGRNAPTVRDMLNNGTWHLGRLRHIVEYTKQHSLWTRQIKLC